MTATPRLKVLQESLKKKEAELDRRFDDHFTDVKSANGQPLNDKRNGSATLDRWDRQSDAIRTLKKGIESTKRAIEIEEDKIANVESTPIPLPIREMLDAGQLTQWRKHPNTFFVPGVDKGRIVYDHKTGDIGVRYLGDISAEQYPKFRDTFRSLKDRLFQAPRPAST